MRRKETPQRLDPAMFDARVARADTGLVHQFLEIEPDRTISADHHVGADAVKRGHVTHRVGQATVAIGVDDKIIDLSSRCGGQGLTEKGSVRRNCNFGLTKARGLCEAGCG